MAFNIKIGYGSLGRSKIESNNPQAPTHSGSITFEQPVPAGAKVYISAWPKVGDDGSKFFSLAIEAKQGNGSGGARAASGYRPRQQGNYRGGGAGNFQGGGGAPVGGGGRFRDLDDDEIPF